MLLYKFYGFKGGMVVIGLCYFELVFGWYYKVMWELEGYEVFWMVLLK